jgi:hypothetical protein
MTTPSAPKLLPRNVSAVRRGRDPANATQTTRDIHLSRPPSCHPPCVALEYALLPILLSRLGVCNASGGQPGR